jgi:hypothetical protein
VICNLADDAAVALASFPSASVHKAPTSNEIA